MKNSLALITIGNCHFLAIMGVFRGRGARRSPPPSQNQGRIKGDGGKEELFPPEAGTHSGGKWASRSCPLQIQRRIQGGGRPIEVGRGARRS